MAWSRRPWRLWNDLQRVTWSEKSKALKADRGKRSGPDRDAPTGKKRFFNKQTKHSLCPEESCAKRNSADAIKFLWPYGRWCQPCRAHEAVRQPILRLSTQLQAEKDEWIYIENVRRCKVEICHKVWPWRLGYKREKNAICGATGVRWARWDKRRDGIL